MHKGSNLKEITLKGVYTIYGLDSLIKSVRTLSIEKYQVKLRMPNARDRLVSNPKPLICEVSRKVNPSSQVFNIFKDISEHWVPIGSNIESTSLTDETHFMDKYLPKLTEMPIEFQNFIKTEFGDAYKIATQLFHILKWRHNIKGTIAVSHREDYFILNRIKYPLPDQISGRIKSIQMFELDKFNASEVKNFYRDNNPPTSFSVLINIDKIIANNEEIAIVQGYSALEIAVKELLAEQSNTISTIIFEIPIPPLAKILKLLDNTRLAMRVSFPKKIVQKVEKIASIRNSIAHKGVYKKKEENNIEENMDFIINLIYLTYYYRGFKWSLNNISDKFLEDYFGSDRSDF